MPIDSVFLKEVEFKHRFVQSDAELIKDAKETIFRGIIVDFTQMTRLSLVYMLSLPRFPESEMKQEFIDYFTTLDLDTVLTLNKQLATSVEYTISQLLHTVIAILAVKEGLTSNVEELIDVRGFGSIIFEEAVKSDASDVVDQMIVRQTDLGHLATYVEIAVKYAKLDYYQTAVNRYLELEESREELLSSLDIRESVDVNEAAKMILSISPESELDAYEGIFHTLEPDFFAAFVTQSVDRFDWLNSTDYLEGDELDIVEAILNHQV